AADASPLSAAIFEAFKACSARASAAPFRRRRATFRESLKSERIRETCDWEMLKISARSTCFLPFSFNWSIRKASCLVGNSSAGIRECSFLGVPVVNVGDRQIGRERGSNVIDVGYSEAQIEAAIEVQCVHGRYESTTLYGTGKAGERIAVAVTA